MSNIIATVVRSRQPLSNVGLRNDIGILPQATYYVINGVPIMNGVPVSRGAAGIAGSSQGITLQDTGSGASVKGPVPSWPTLNQMSWLMVGRTASSTTTTRSLFRGVSGSFLPGLLSGANKWWVAPTTASGLTIYEGPTMQTLTNVIVVVTWRTGSKPKLWINGKQEAVTAISGVDPPTGDIVAPANVISVLGNEADGEHPVNSQATLMIGFLRELSEYEAMSFSMNPWQVFNKIYVRSAGVVASAGNRRRRFFIGAAA